jgi:hypothetical protein
MVGAFLFMGKERHILDFVDFPLVFAQILALAHRSATIKL